MVITAGSMLLVQTARVHSRNESGQLVLSNLNGKEENVSVVNLKGWEARIYRF